MKKNVSNYFLEGSPYNNKLTSSLDQASKIPVSILTKLAEKERIEMKTKSFLKRKHFVN